MNPQTNDPLAQLRDIHLPQPVSLWPPAPGWWIVALALVLTLAVLLYCWLRHRRNNRYRRLALQELGQLSKTRDYSADTLRHLNSLLKRTLRAAPQAPAAAGLSGSEWLRFLDSSGNTREFSDGPGQLLVSAPYAPQSLSQEQLQQIPQLCDCIKRWILTHKFSGGEEPC